MAAGQAGQRRVLVTRPALQADALLDALQVTQWQAVALPMLDIVPRRDPATQARLAQVLQPQSPQPKPPQSHASRSGEPAALAIFVSTNAVSCTAQLLDAAGFGWPPALACIGIGPATRAAISARGWPRFDEFTASAPRADISSAHANTYSSAELLAQLSGITMRGRAVTVFSGVGGRREIDAELARRGARTGRVETYRRLRPVYSEAEFSAGIARFLAGSTTASAGQAAAGCEQAMLFASGETLANFFWYARGSTWLERLRAVVAIVPSERVAQLGRQAGLQRVVVAGNASQQAFLHALQSL